ncbi:MAG: PIN domain-containing protein [Bacteroides sp.]|nr:PIN domain-containing protein [Bacteroides sp.]MCM1085850.1 PIN domain-containing protein [Bacteroides sp.]
MKTLFPGYYCQNEHECKSFWKDCQFVLDTNVLLDIYRYSQKSTLEILDVLKKVGNRLWIPYQVAKEYHNNLYLTIKKQSETYKDTIKKIEDLQQIIAVKRGHPFLDESDIADFNSSCNDFKVKLEHQKKEVRLSLLENKYKDILADLLSGKINTKPTEDKLEGLRKEGKQRYEKKIPPGYMDANKSNDEMYGDFILWYEVKEYAKQNKKDIIFVTNDQKEDWFLRVDGLTICARPELIAEFQQDTAQKIYICNLERFMEGLEKYVELSITQPVVAEIQEQQQIKQDERTEAGGDDLNFSRGETSTLQGSQSAYDNVISLLDDITSVDNS